MRPWWHRTLAAVLALWLVALVAEPAAVHPCPMHDGVASASGAALAHAGMRMAASGMDDAHPGAPAHAHGCTCLGDCAAAGWAATAARAPRLALAGRALVARAIVPTATNAAFRLAEPAHARPPSIGPPPVHLA